VPYEPALTDAFEPDGTVSADYAAQKFCFLLMVNTAPTLSPLERRVMNQFLLKYLNMQSDTAWPAVETIAKELGATRRGIQMAIRRLTKLGWLDVDEGGGSGRTSTYRFPVPPDVVKIGRYPWYEWR
jgi:hypothetical protein